MTFVITVKLIKMLGEANRDVLNKYEKKQKGDEDNFCPSAM